MSLLLDALQRASEEKEKLAAARSSEAKQEPTAGHIDQSPLPTISEDSSLDETAPVEHPSAADSLPTLEFSSEPDSSSLSADILTNTSVAHAEQQTPAPVEMLAIEMSSQPEPIAFAPSPDEVDLPQSSNTAEQDKSNNTIHRAEEDVHPIRREPVQTQAQGIPLREVTPNTTSPLAHPSPVISSQVAQDILGATAKPSKSKKGQLIVLAAMVLLLVVLIACYALGLFNKATAPDPIFNPYAQQDAAAVSEPTASEKLTAAEAAGGNVASANPASDGNTTLTSTSQTQTATQQQDQPSLRSANKNVKTSRPRSRQQTDNGTTKPVFVTTPVATTPLDIAYAALKQGRYDDAAASYQQALARNSGEVDALLGLAYIAQRQGHNNEARAYYSEVLRQNPGHPAATSGLLSIASESDLQAASSNAGEMARRNPDSAVAQSTFGNLLAKQGRIAEAQQAYFRAFTLEPANALHAYNLAVALDRLHKYSQALPYYKRAMALSENGNGQASFPRSSALQRIDQLEKTVGSDRQVASEMAK